MAFSRDGLIEQLEYDGFTMKMLHMGLIIATLIGTNRP